METLIHSISHDRLEAEIEHLKDIIALQWDLIINFMKKETMVDRLENYNTRKRDRLTSRLARLRRHLGRLVR